MNAIRRLWSGVPIEQMDNAEATGSAMAPLARWGHPLAIATAIAFGVSSAFPAVAAFVHDTASWPQWWGTLDVGLAFVLAVLAFLVLGVTRGHVNERAKRASYHAYRGLAHGLLALCVVYMLFGEYIILGNCLTGFAWRAWLLLYILPAWLTAFRAGRDTQPNRAERTVAPDGAGLGRS